MVLNHLIKADSVLCNVQARSRKHCLEILSELLAQKNTDIAHEEIFARLIERERLGCTGLSRGVAFPHCRVSGLQESVAAMLKLSEPVDFETPDGKPVDLVFGMLVPVEPTAGDFTDIENVTIYLREDAVRSRLRAAATSSELYRALVGNPADKPVAAATAAGN